MLCNANLFFDYYHQNMLSHANLFLTCYQNLPSIPFHQMSPREGYGMCVFSSWPHAEGKAGSDVYVTALLVLALTQGSKGLARPTKSLFLLPKKKKNPNFSLSGFGRAVMLEIKFREDLSPLKIDVTFKYYWTYDC